MMVSNVTLYKYPVKSLSIVIGGFSSLQLVVMTTHLMQLEATRCRGDTDGAITDAGGSTSQTKETCDPDGEGKVWQSEDDLCHKCTCRVSKSCGAFVYFAVLYNNNTAVHRVLHIILWDQQ